MRELRSSRTLPHLARWLGRLLLVMLGLALLLNAPRKGTAANTIAWSEVSPPASSGIIMSIDLGDVNEDGHLDLVVSRYEEGIAVYAGDGAAGWTSLPTVTTDGTYNLLALGDVNNDGKLDIAAAHDFLGVNVWTGDGAGGWVAGTSPVATGRFWSVALGDVNRDGNLDIAAGSGQNLGLKAWLGNGAGGWTTASSGLPTTGTYTGIAIGDVDRNGRPDLAAASDGTGVEAWEGSGSGSWTDNSAGLPASGDYYGLALGDLDNDGDLDIVAASDGEGVGAWTVSGGSTWTWLNASTKLPTTGSYWGIAVGDVDNDGKLDIASGSYGGGVKVWSGDGGGSWSEESTGLPLSGMFTDVALGDLDDDGMLDLAAAQMHTGVRTWRDAGTPDALGGWNPIASPTTSGLYWSVDVGDLDRDGKLDILAASEGNGIQLWTGDGGNGWSEISSWTSPDLPTSGSYRSVAFGEIEHNGYPDVVAGSGDGGGLHVWLFRDASAWNERSTGLPSGGTYLGIDLGDFDNNGTLDIAGAGEGLGVRAWAAKDFDTGSGYWDPSSSGLPSTGTYNCVALGDLNSDGYLDLVAGSAGSGVLVWQGDGGGGWTAQADVIDSGSWLGVALGDVNDDGALDLLAASDNLGVRAWAGDGGFGWVSLTSPASNGNYSSATLGDLDNDGHLDVAAGSGSDAGLVAWTGDGGTTWTPYTTNLPSAGDYPGVAFGDVDNDGLLDVVGARYGGGSVHVWTGAEGAPPGGWDSFSPTDWISSAQQADCTVQVQDSGSGLDVGSAEYRFLGAAGTWSEWQAAGCSGSSGDTTPQIITALNVPFNQDSGPAPEHEGNWVQFRVADVAGNTGYSDPYLVYIDTTPPDNPTSFPDSSHWPGGACLNDEHVWVDWDEASDATSGLDGYSYLFSASPQLPDALLRTMMSEATSNTLGEGHWYISVRTRDVAGNWAPGFASDGPYCIDTGPPTNPTGFFSSPLAGVWVNVNTVEIDWVGATDAGSGVYGYSLAWSESPGSVPDDEPDTTGTSTTSPVLGDGDGWYFHIRTRDNAGNWASDAAHYGAFYIDTAKPLAWINMSSHVADTNPFPVRWLGSDAGSGVSTFDVVTSTNGTDWFYWILDTTSLSDSFLGEAGQTVYFKVRADDNAGNVGDWSSPFDITLGVDVTVRVEDEWGTPLSGAVVYLNGEEQGSTAPDGTLVVHDAAGGDELAAKYLVEEQAATKGEHEWPYGSDWSYRTYITNVDFDADGNPLLHTISGAHTTQVLVVRRDNPLVGFHILVSVEWDADSTFLDQVVTGFQSASDYLFDLTDGQMLFEAIEVVDDKVHWADADFRIYASNTQWPHARIDGIWQGAGAHAHLGRYFDSTTSNTGPWDQPDAYRTAIHEFGHYGFGLYDEYLDSDGIEDGGCTTDRATTPVAEQACFMDSQYSATEICSSLPGHPHNTDTMQHAIHAEPCWTTIHRQFDSPTGQWDLEGPQHRGSIMTGPADVPVDEWIQASVTDADTGVCPPFEVLWTHFSGKPVLGALVWVENGRIILQGETQTDGGITILGAHDGETVELSLPCGHFCSYSDEVHASCTAATARVELQHTVTLDPFGLHVGAVPRGGGEELELRVKASTDLSGPPDVALWQDGAVTPLQVVLILDPGTGAYTGTVTMADTLGLGGQLRIQAHNLDGQPVTTLAPFKVTKVAYREPTRVTSVGGNMDLYLKPHTFLTDTAVIIQPNREVSVAQDNLLLVGDAYEVSLSPGDVSLGQPVAVNLRYHSDMVADVAPGSLQIYYWDDVGALWVPLGGTHAPEQNLVSAQTDHLSTFAVVGRRRGEDQVYLPVVQKEWVP
jgi:hypothetical protein